MPSLLEGSLRFDFVNEWDVSKPDGWSFYRNQFQQIVSGTKAIDILAIEPTGTAVWCIEVKDYRDHPRTKTVGVAEETAAKVRDSLALFAAARFNANDAGEKASSTRALTANHIRVVLHLEQREKPSKLFPRKIDLANVQQRLRQLVKSVDPHACVRESSDMQGCPWGVSTV
jgi:hypothetical protein